MPAKATRKSFGEAVARLGEAHPELVVCDADLGKSTQTGGFQKKFPERYFQFGIAEQNMIGTAAGLALCGKTPFVTSFACFLIGRLETIRVAVAYNRSNVKLVGTHAGVGIGEDGTSQMGLEDIAAMRALPHMTVLQPADDREAQQAVEWLLRHEGPAYLRLTRQDLEEVHGPDYRFRPGVCDTVYEPGSTPALAAGVQSSELSGPPPSPRERGSNPGGAAQGVRGKLSATIFATGGTVAPAIRAAKDLLARGFAARVVNAGSLAPFDGEAVARAASDSQRIVAVEDHNIHGGLGSAVCEALAERGVACPVLRLGLRDFGESAEGAELYDKYGLSADHIAEACIRNLN